MDNAWDLIRNMKSSEYGGFVDFLAVKGIINSRGWGAGDLLNAFSNKEIVNFYEEFKNEILIGDIVLIRDESIISCTINEYIVIEKISDDEEYMVIDKSGKTRVTDISNIKKTGNRINWFK